MVMMNQQQEQYSLKHNTLKDCRKKDKKALYYLDAKVDEEVMKKIQHATTTKKARDKLHTSYKGDDKVKNVRLQTARARFDYVIAAIEEGKDLKTMTIDGLMSSLCAHEYRMDLRSDAGSIEQAFQSKVSVMEKGSSSREVESKASKPKRRYDKSKVRCYHCKKLGHYRKEYGVEERETLLLACSVYEEEELDKWYLDTGCSNHMCGKKEQFHQLDESVRGDVSFGNKTKVQIMGKGKILIRLKNGSHGYISDVYYVPSLHWNLLSLGQLCERGFKIMIEDGVCRIENKKNELVAYVKMTKNRMFPLNLYVEFVKDVLFS
ncbi:uncharacterized protein LOC113290919 [Papaver somniferum]|uniref:uncharacterized protein LOC113290919 n=1 Tax=Papaver somniferum TaxID=3469 RepID=UPI000E6F4F2C|nr:uncharacterized protein LOC113290919 [Papaver somniferum]